MKDSDGHSQTYHVGNRDGTSEGRIVKMDFNTKEGTCECKLFEFEGIPCKHLLRVLDKFYLNEIPSAYIMKRWTKDANRLEIVSQEKMVVMCDSRVGN